MSEGSKSVPSYCEVELDIFSGMPNPTWILTNAEAGSFMKKLAELPRGPSRELSNHLGYRGFIVRCSEEANAQLIRVQNGTVQMPNEGNPYARDTDRGLERWLLDTGKRHLKDELWEMLKREVQ